MSALAGVRVALLEARLEGELASLVRRYGGEPVCAPALREAPIDCGPEVTGFLDDLTRERCHVLLLQTGVGTKLLFDQAERLGRLPQLVAACTRLTVLARGPKPSAALRDRGVRPSVIVGDPYTTAEVLDALASLDLEGMVVALVHYGERNEVLVEELQGRGVTVRELQLYAWLLPEDLGPLRALVRAIVEGEIQAIAFTSQIQIRHLFHVAREMALTDEVALALRSRTATASVGPTCTATLQAFGITPTVEAAPPKMRPLIAALTRHFEHRGKPAAPSTR